MEAVDHVARLSRADCRAAFEERFDAACMASNYERVYHRLVRGPLPQLQIPEPANMHQAVPAA